MCEYLHLSYYPSFSFGLSVCFTLSLSLSLYLSIYMSICVYVCVCVSTHEGFLHFRFSRQSFLLKGFYTS